MEITNNSRHYTIPLVVGRRIAQIIFFYTGEIRGVDYTALGKYQGTSDVEALKKEWHPEMMLPRLYKDREVVPR
jgi:deoxycytidine triphosphate deaminase